jgi:peptide deformylase
MTKNYETIILTEESALLHETSEPVTNFASEDLKSFIEHMFDIMLQNNGAGLAASQIGLLKSLFVYGFDFNPRYPNAPPVPKTVVINPEIIWQSDDTVDLEEGCLSVPNRRVVITRCKSITYTTFDIDGKKHEKTVSGFEARIVQHEIDHLNGVLISDRAKAMYDTSIQ